MKSKKDWIKDMNMKKGALHEALGVPMGEKIPIKKKKEAAKKGDKLGKRAKLALTLDELRKKVRK